MLPVLLLLVLLVRPGALAIILPPEMVGRSLNQRGRTEGPESYGCWNQVRCTIVSNTENLPSLADKGTFNYLFLYFHSHPYGLLYACLVNLLTEWGR